MKILKNRLIRIAIYLAIILGFIIYKYNHYDSFDPTNGGTVIHVGQDVNEIKEKLYFNGTKNYIILFLVFIVAPFEYVLSKNKRVK